MPIQTDHCSTIVNQLLSLFTQKTPIRQRMKDIFEQLSLVSRPEQLCYFHVFDGKLYLEGNIEKNGVQQILPHFPLKNWNTELFDLVEKFPKNEGVNFTDLGSGQFGVAVTINEEFQSFLYLKNPETIDENAQYYLRLLTGMIHLYFNDQRGKEQNKILQRSIKRYQENGAENYPLKGHFKMSGEWNSHTGEIFPNEASINFWGKSPRNLIHFIDLIHVQEKKSVEKQLIRTSKERNLYDKLFFKMLDLNEVYRPVLMIVEKSKDTLYKWWIIDISNEMETTSGNVESYQFQRMLNLCPTAIISINTTGEITLINQAALDIFGHAKDELIGKNIKILMPETHANLHQKYIERYLESGHPKILHQGREVVGRRKNGELVPLLIHIEEEIQAGQIAFYGFIEDLSEKKALIDQNNQLQNKKTKTEVPPSVAKPEIHLENPTSIPESIGMIEEKIKNCAYIDSNLIQLLEDQLAPYDSIKAELKELRAYLSNLDYTSASTMIAKIKEKWGLK